MPSPSRIVLAALLALVALGCLVARVEAAPFTPEAERYYQAALVYWGATPACDEVERVISTREEMVSPIGWGEQPTCAIRIWEGVPTGCYLKEAIFHETYHLLFGPAHSSDPTSPAYYRITGIFCKPRHVKQPSWAYENNGKRFALSYTIRAPH